ncbi:MAG: hypothetical protein ACLFU8_05565 [Anaerolineales bacterium]
MLTILKLFEEHGKTLLLIAGGLIGIVLGLLIAWILWPVTFTNATPGHLRSDFQLYYFNSAAEDYSQNRDLELAKERLGLKLEDPNDNPWTDDPENLETFLEKEVLPRTAGGQFEAMDRLARDLAADQGLELEQPTPVETAVPDDATEGGGRRSALLIVVGLLIVLALVGGAFYFFTRSQEKAAARRTGRSTAYGVVSEEEEAEGAPTVGETGPPLSSFTATYVLGDDFFDPSFSIESGPDFLGECGIGISESIGVGDPKKVTALEAWLFDKSDIRTVTTVLASEYAYEDPSLGAKLAAKGEVVEVKPGQEVVLETTALRVRVRIREVEYAEGDLPDNSFFQRVAVELRAWVKGEEGGAEAA